MEIGAEWWDANCVSGGENKEELVEIKGQYLTHVAHVRVLGPPNRENYLCDIHGEISFTVGDDTVTLYSRDTPELVDLDDDEEGGYLTLTDDPESQRPLGAVSPDNPLHVTMKLYEKTGSEDVLIALLSESDCLCQRHLGRCFYVTGESGFRFEVCYSVVFGARVEVGVTFTDGGGGCDRRIPTWGHIAALQFLEDLPDNDLDVTPCGKTVTTLRAIEYRSPAPLGVGKPIELDRRFVVVPMIYDTYLCIVVAPVFPDQEFAVWHRLYFPLSKLISNSFWTNKEMTHTKDLLHEGFVFHVSIRFIVP